jgi:hypothetical protein
MYFPPLVSNIKNTIIIMDILHTLYNTLSISSRTASRQK